LVYTAGALTLLIWLALAGQSLWGLPAGAYALLLGLAIGPQLLGHSSFNWAIKYLSATLVTVAILGEPIGAALLAIVIFDQTLQPLQVLGGALLLGGIAVTTLAERRTQMVGE
jgi:drug/metabolite transporter (DMT)-like permease